MNSRSGELSGDRRDINVGSVFEQTYVNTFNGYKAARDPHFDLTQTFRESDFGITSDVRKNEGSIFNTIIAGYDVYGALNEYQGMFFADASRPDESAIWNARLERSGRSDSTLLAMVGSSDVWGPIDDPESNLDPDTVVSTLTAEQLISVPRHLRFIHIGPNIVAPPPGPVGFKISTMPGGVLSPPDGNSSKSKDIFWYETDGFTYDSTSAATPSSLDGWDLTPNEYLHQIEGTHWQVSDRPNIEVYLASMGFTYDDLTPNETLFSSSEGSGITPAIGPFRYNSNPISGNSLNYTYGGDIGNNSTSSQIRFDFWGPLNDRNGVQIHAGNTGNISGHVDMSANSAYTQLLKDNRIEIHVNYTNNDGVGVTSIYRASDDTNEQSGYISLTRSSLKTPGITSAGLITITLVQS